MSRLSDLSTLALETLGQQLLRAAADFDVLIIDTAAGISASVTHFLSLAQETIVLATPALASTLDASPVRAVLRTLPPHPSQQTPSSPQP